MSLGMPTLIELQSIEESAALCVELGLQFIEINMNMPQYQIGRLDMKELKKVQGTGVYFTFHLDENLNIADFNDKVSAAYMDTVLATIRIAKEIEAPIINMHMSEGVHFKLPSEKVYLFEKYNDFYMNSMREFRDRCGKLAAGPVGGDVKICIENTNGYLPFQEKAIDFLLESGNFALTYDIGHDFCAGNVDERFIAKRAGKLRHMHIHDAVGDRSHLVLGSGEIDIAGKLAFARSHNCSCVLETKTVAGLRESAATLKKN